MAIYLATIIFNQITPQRHNVPKEADWIWPEDASILLGYYVPAPFRDRMNVMYKIAEVEKMFGKEKKGDLSGCRGAHAANLDFFKDCRYILESDRKGASDLIIQGKDVPLCEADFIPQEILDKYHYQPTNGGKTDVVELKMRGLDIPVCNISCGYYNAHHSNEYTKFDELQNCLYFIKELIKAI